MASLATIKPGDIVMVDVKGRRGFAEVVAKKPKTKDSQAKLSIKPISAGFNWREVTSYQVINHYRKTKNTKKVGIRVSTGHDAAE